MLIVLGCVGGAACSCCAEENHAIGEVNGSDSLFLVRQGKAEATIVIPDDADSWTRMAAGWVLQYVEKASGARLAILPESKAPSGNLISVGHTQLANKAGIGDDGLKYDGCKMVVNGNIVFLLGRDTKSLGIQASPREKTKAWEYEREILRRYGDLGAKGTCRAATRFLERFCGIRWLVPAEQGTDIPVSTNITVPAKFEESFSPFFMYHSNRSLYGSPLSSPGAYANNYRVATRLLTAGGHPAPRWVPASIYWQRHPEYFAMLDGQRSPAQNHLCLSNPEVQELFRQAIADAFDSGYDLVQIGLADGYRPCQCPVCNSMDNYPADMMPGEGPMQYEARLESNPCERVLMPFKNICQDLLASHPDKYVHLLIYGPTRNPPTSFESFPVNTIAEICGNGDPELVKRWAGKTGGSTVYTYWYDHTLWLGIGVRMTPVEAGDMIKFYANNDVRGIHGGGGYNWGLMGATYYVTGKLMGDPSLDVKELVREYCDGLYGSASDEMHDFFDALWTKSDYRFQSTRMSVTERMMLYYPPGLVSALDDLLGKAERAAQTPRQKNWVRVARDEFDYIRLLSNAMYLYKAYMVNKDRANLLQLRAAVKAFDAYRMRMCSYGQEYVRDYFTGHGYLTCYLTAGVNGSGYGSTWADMKERTDLEALAGSRVGFGQACVDQPLTLDFDSDNLEPELRVAYAEQPPEIDGLLHEKEWEKAKPVFMRGRQQSKVRALYDNDNIYVSYVCQETERDDPSYYDMVRDDLVCTIDCIEFFVDPASSTYSRRYYHFILGAGPDAIYDDRTGFKRAGDFSDQDMTWNAPGLQYGFSAVKGRHWIIEMKVPFEDIDTATPMPGQAWLGNLARERGSDLYQWSRGGSGFCDPKSFARFVFEKP